jgi:Zn-dependent membrane protease YugP
VAKRITLQDGRITAEREAEMIWRKFKNKLLTTALIISIVAFVLVMTNAISLDMMGSLLYSVWIVVLIVWLSIRFVDNRRKKKALEADGSFDIPPEFQEKDKKG